MQRSCHRCGFVSERPTRFCRQCGAQLIVENEATSATTRQYAPQQPANPYDAPYQSQLAQARSAPDNRFDNQTPDTSHLYQAPMAQNYPNYPAPYQQAVAKNSGALKWIVITLICIALVSGAISVMVISAIRARQAVSEQAREALDPREIAPPAPPAAPPPPSTNGAGLEKYKYPNAKVEKTSKVFGIETVEMTTSDSVSEVRDYYKERLGDPMLEDDDSAAVFQIPGPPVVIITINQGEQDSDKTEIKVVRTNSQLNRMN
jgi:hypothetical protein